MGRRGANLRKVFVICKYKKIPGPEVARGFVTAIAGWRQLRIMAGMPAIEGSEKAALAKRRMRSKVACLGAIAPSLDFSSTCRDTDWLPGEKRVEFFFIGRRLERWIFQLTHNVIMKRVDYFILTPIERRFWPNYCEMDKKNFKNM